jgi:hypothetical protein
MAQGKEEAASRAYGPMARIGVGFETERYRVLGNIVLHKDTRLSDTLNRQKDFIVIEQASVFSLDNGVKLREQDPLMLHKEAIIFAWEQN